MPTMNRILVSIVVLPSTALGVCAQGVREVNSCASYFLHLACLTLLFVLFLKNYISPNAQSSAILAYFGALCKDNRLNRC